MYAISRLIWVAILIGSFAAATASYFYGQADEAEQTNRLSAQVTSRLNDQLTVLEGIRALYLSNKDGNDTNILEYLRKIHTHARSVGIQGVGIITATTAAEQPSRLARIRSTYGPSAHIWPQTSDNLSYPITLIEPYDTLNSKALGFDMYSEPIRRRAIQRASTTGQASASNIVQLIQLNASDNNQPGFILFLPIIDIEATSNSNASQRPQHISKQPVAAFAYAPIRVHDLINAMLSPLLPSIAGVRVYAGNDAESPLVYKHGNLKFGAQEAVIRIADREWKMVISYQADFNRFGRPIIVLIFGIIMAILLIRLNRDQRRRIDAYRALAEEKARHAEDRELIIGEMAHRLKNAFARIGALARITIRESNNLSEFETRFDGRLRALADTKQMMLTGSVATLDLSRLIHREMELAGWPSDSHDMINGPPVHLDDEGAQAIALVIHELVTNSIKYGALSGTGQLSVSWDRVDGRIILSWIESGLSATPIIDQESFGTHFIRSLIQRQLRGDWQRTAETRQLTVRINWPDNA